MSVPSPIRFASVATAFLFASSPSAAEPTFARDIAPILFQHCAPCHRRGQSAPFNLLNFEDAKKRSHDIAKATRDRYMPPWLPEEQGTFLHERRLTSEEIQLLQDWHAAGSPQGNPADAPASPSFEEGWLLGKPDLVVEFPAPYTLAADGPDLYRNFVVPTRLE